MKDRVLLSALIFSVAWHLFWLSALTVVVSPKDTRPPKFSSVSFLGPILEQSMLKVSSAVHERSIPEKRFLFAIKDPRGLTGNEAGPENYADDDPGAAADIFESDEILAQLAVSAIDGDKLEPGNSQ